MIASSRIKVEKISHLEDYSQTFIFFDESRASCDEVNKPL